MVTDGQDQSEFDFLSFCHQMKDETTHDWNSLVVNYSAVLNPRALLKDVPKIDDVLRHNREQALKTFHFMNEEAKKLKTKAVSYIFADNDIALFADLHDPLQKGMFHDLRYATAAALPPSVTIQQMSMQDDFQKMLDLGDAKIVSARRMRGYHAIGANNTSKRTTLDLRRSDRKLPVVMLVEDDRFAALYATQLLAKDYEVVHVRTGEEAAEYYLDYAPDIVFIDVHLPGMKGTDVLRVIKAIDPDAHCVMVSVDSAAGEVIDASRGGAHSYLRKPYNKERLLWTARQSLHVPSGAGTLVT